jgi:hypothetical protein
MWLPNGRLRKSTLWAVVPSDQSKGAERLAFDLLVIPDPLNWGDWVFGALSDELQPHAGLTLALRPC